jgi:hypothetical protein
VYLPKRSEIKLKPKVKRSEEKIDKALEQFVDQKQIRKGYYQSSIQKVWKEMMGDIVADYTSSIKISGDKLILEFTSASLKQEFLYKKDKLVTMLNDRMGKEVITKVIIR